MNKLLIAYWRDWRADIYRWIAAMAIFALFAWFMADYYDYFDRCVNDAPLCTPHRQSADTAK